MNRWSARRSRICSKPGAAITGQYLEFASLCFVDTLGIVGLHTDAYGSTADLFAGVSDDNVARIKRQNSRRISVVIGNPPYNANQANENDNNKNREYPFIDERIKMTYIAESTAQKAKLHDLYAPFFRWASDRLHADGGLAFVTNRSFIDSRTFAVFARRWRPSLPRSAWSTWAATCPPTPSSAAAGTTCSASRPAWRSVFSSRRRARSTAAASTTAAGPSWRRPRKSWPGWATRGNARLAALASEELRPDAKANWLNRTHNDFEALMPVIDMDAKTSTRAVREKAIFKLFGNGINTARDDWVTDFSADDLARKVKLFLGEFGRHASQAAELGTVIKWSRTSRPRPGHCSAATGPTPGPPPPARRPSAC